MHNANTQSVTIFVVPHQPRHNPVYHHFSQLYKSARQLSASPFEVGQSGSWPRGTTPMHMLYELGHGTPMPVNKKLQPADIRRLREGATQARLSGGALHLFGVLDHDSPVGSRNLIEQSLRLLEHGTIPVVLHLGHWHLTPRELHFALREIKSCAPDVPIGSVFSVIDVQDLSIGHSFGDSLMANSKQVGLRDVSVRNPYQVLHDSPITDQDVLFIIGHDDAMLGRLSDKIHHTSGVLPHRFDTDFVTPPQWEDFLLHQAVDIFSNEPEYALAYFGGQAASHLKSLDGISVPDQLASHSFFFVDDKASRHDAQLAQVIDDAAGARREVYWMEPHRMRPHMAFRSDGFGS